MKATPYGKIFDNSFESCPCPSTLLSAIAMDCGDNILPAATPSEFNATIQYGLTFKL